MIGRFSQVGVYRELVRSRDFARVATAGGLALASYLYDSGNDAESAAGVALALISVALNGFPIIVRAVKELIRRKVNVDELVSIAIIACLLDGEYLTAAVVSFVMVLGSLIEEATSNSARRAIRSLMEISPEEATVIEGGKTRIIPVSMVKVGDILLIKPGERVPVDAVIGKGITAIDESSMTGEPIPRQKTVGDMVYAGTLNQSGVIEITTAKIGADTTLGKIIKLVSDAETYKPRTTKLIDRYAGWFTPAILACAGIAWWISGDVSRAVAVLIVGCPCALILAAPTAVVATIGRAAKSGILVKGGVFLESAGRANVVLFDKTGTLTEGDPRVGEIVAAEGIETNDVLSSAACVEQNSTHPLARAVLKAAHYAKISICCVEDMITEIGLGVRARLNGQLVEVGSAYIGGGIMCVPPGLRCHIERFREEGETPMVVYREKQPIGIISVADHVRPAAKEAVRRLRALGINRIGVLSGDHEKSARLVAETVGLTDVWSEMKPGDKLKVIRGFQSPGHVVLFVGDGINDAPALAAADVGVAMGADGTDVALETADIALMNDDITKIPFLIFLSRRMRRVIKWNIVFGMAFNAVAVIAGGGGFLSPIMGAIVHNIGSVLVVISSASMAFVSEVRE